MESAERAARLRGGGGRPAHDYAYHDEILALSTWTTILRDSAEAVAPVVAGDGDFLLFNPSPEARRERLESCLGHTHDRGRDIPRSEKRPTAPRYLRFPGRDPTLPPFGGRGRDRDRRG